MNMSPKAKERFEITGWSIAIAMLGVITYFSIDAHQMIKHSYEQSIKQDIINESVWKGLATHSNEIDNLQLNVAGLSADIKKLDLDYEKIRDRQYNLQSKN